MADIDWGWESAWPQLTKLFYYLEVKMKFLLEVKPAISSRDRHAIEDALKRLGYRLNGGGQRIDGSSSDISFSSPEEKSSEGG